MAAPKKHKKWPQLAKENRIGIVFERLVQKLLVFQEKLKLIYYRIKIPRPLLKYLESKKFGFLKVKKNKIQLYSRITDIAAVRNYNLREFY